MAHWLASTRDGQDSDWLARFDPRFWTVDFPRPMLAALTTPAPDRLRIDATFLRAGDLAGVIWASADTLDHPLLAYATVRDYAHCTLRFRWQSAGVLPLDAVNGPTLTIEGRDATGAPRTWYVRLWNYATGTPADAQITLNFSALAGGFLHPAEADPVHPAEIDRMFISLVAPGHVPGSTAPLSAPVDGWIELSDIAADGANAVLALGDVIVPPHGLALATAYDDATNQSPARLIRQALQLGYRGSLLHYAGMSHFMRLGWQDGAFRPVTSGDPLSAPARAWHAAFLAEAKARGFAPILSLSYELLAQYCPPTWQQRASNGDPALTGWDPPSTLLSPANAAAMAWLHGVAAQLVQLMVAANVPVRFQIGEPWWWIMPDGRPCLYDAAARAAFGGNPKAIPSMRAPLDAQRKALLTQAGVILASSTAALRDAVRAAAAPLTAEVLLLAFLPSVLDPDMPDALRANLPVGWAAPAYDRLQIEDYDWLTTGRDGLRRAAYLTVSQRLGYAPAAQDYLAGFALSPGDNAAWQAINQGCDEALARAHHETFVWALPQISRDGFVRLPAPAPESAMQAFDDLSYPLALGRDAAVTPEFSTTIAVTASGHERRNSLWADARLRFDVGPGLRSEAELGVLLSFFRARRGAARGFRLRDPADFSSSGMIGMPASTDQDLGTGDGQRTRFALIKRYGSGPDAQVRRITRPVAAALLVGLNGVAVTGGWTLDPLGELVFAVAPAAGVTVSAGFLFDVPVRFAEDRLELSSVTFAAGDAPSVPLVELREAA